MALNNVPLAGQTLGVTRNPINQNFSTINNAFAIDHVTMTPPGTAQPQGYHNQVSLVLQGASPAPSWGTTYNGIYCLQSAVTSIQETFLHNQSASGAFDFPVTASIFSTTAVPQTINTLGGQGWCYLPSGFIMKWGTLAASASSPYSFPVASNIPPFTTAVMTLQLTMGNTVTGTNDTIRYYNVTNTGFNWFANNVTTNSRFTYLAIGY